MDRERAERHLRLVAEAALRRARALPRDNGQVQPRDVYVACVRRFQWAAWALIAVGALDASQAERILDELQAALAVRHLPAMPSFPALRPPPPAPAARRAPASSRPPSLLPVGRMLPFRDETGTGELYLMSLLVTGVQAIVTAVARFRVAGRNPIRLPLLPGAVTAADDLGTSYQVTPGGVMQPDWSGHLEIRPAPPAGARWLELSAAAGASVRIDLTGPVASSQATVEPLSAPPAERLLENVAQRILAAAAEPGGTARQTADGAGEMVTALEAAGALSPFSATPGYLATVCERLDIDDHGITARPTARLPEPWLSVLACYGRRHHPAVRDGTAAVAVLLPELDGARIALTGLHNARDHSYLHIFGSDLPQALPIRAGLGPYPAIGWWLRDDSGHWHVALHRHGEQGPGDGETALELRVVPPLSHGTACCTLFVTTLTCRAAVRVPLSWWASP